MNTDETMKSMASYLIESVQGFHCTPIQMQNFGADSFIILDLMIILAYLAFR